MQRYAFILILIYLSFDSKSQDFRKVYQGGFLGDNFTLMDNQDGTYLTGYPVRSRIDSDGNLITYRTVSDNSETLNGNRVYYNNFLWGGAYGADSCPPNIGGHPFAVYTDTTLKFGKQRYYNLNGSCNVYSNKVDIISSNLFVMSGRGYLYFTLPDNAFAMAIDSTLDNVLWAKYFSKQGACNFAKQLPDGSFILGLNLKNIGGCLVKLDVTGNIMWCKSFIRPNGIVNDAVVNPDGSILVVGLTDSIAWGFGPYPNWFQNKLFCMKVDTGGHVIWCKGYDDIHPYHWYVDTPPVIRETADSNFVIAATKITNLSANPNLGGHAFLVKIDPNGDTIYTRGYGSRFRVTEFHNMIVTHDNCYLIGGEFAGASPWGFFNTFIYKTDTNGYTPCGGNIIDPITVTPLFYTDSDITLTSIDGATAHVAYGVDTAYGSSVLDDCILLGTAQTPQIINGSLYPNPTKGKITIPKQPPFVRDSFITVYNSMGKIILQKAISTEKDLQLDLSKYGKGMYLVKVREGDKESSSKVVVE